VANPTTAHRQQLAVSPAAAGAKHKPSRPNYWRNLRLHSAIKAASANNVLIALTTNTHNNKNTEETNQRINASIHFYDIEEYRSKVKQKN